MTSAFSCFIACHQTQSLSTYFRTLLYSWHIYILNFFWNKFNQDINPKFTLDQVAFIWLSFLETYFRKEKFKTSMFFFLDFLLAISFGPFLQIIRLIFLSAGAQFKRFIATLVFGWPAHRWILRHCCRWRLLRQMLVTCC
jgi:hypothetical protein